MTKSRLEKGIDKNEAPMHQSLEKILGPLTSFVCIKGGNFRSSIYWLDYLPKLLSTKMQAQLGMGLFGLSCPLKFNSQDNF